VPRYDLRGFQIQSVARGLVLQRWTLFIGSATGLVISGVILTHSILYGGGEEGYIAALVLGPAAVVFGVMAYSKPAPANWIDIGESGIRLENGNRVVRNMKWDDPRFRLTLVRTEGADDWVSSGRPVRAVAWWKSIQTFLPADVYEEILSESSKRRMSILPSSFSYPGWTAAMITRPRDVLASRRP